MIQLDEATVWKELSGPYGNSKEIPSLILALSNTNKKEVADELIWEYIYHQGSVYENTLATVPHLLKIIRESKDDDFKLDLILSLGTVLIGFDENTSGLDNIFTKKIISQKVQDRIQTAFIDAVKEFRNMVDNSFSQAALLDEISKRYFLIACLVTRKKHQEAEMFKTFSENVEYIFVCPTCEEESFLWNEKNVLNAYNKDPVYNDDKIKIEIIPDNANLNLKWLEELIDKIDINSLRPLIPYFKGHLNCHKCGEQENVFAGIMNSF